MKSDVICWTSVVWQKERYTYSYTVKLYHIRPNRYTQLLMRHNVIFVLSLSGSFCLSFLSCICLQWSKKHVKMYIWRTKQTGSLSPSSCLNTVFIIHWWYNTVVCQCNLRDLIIPCNFDTSVLLVATQSEVC